MSYPVKSEYPSSALTIADLSTMTAAGPPASEAVKTPTNESGSIIGDQKDEDEIEYVKPKPRHNPKRKSVAAPLPSVGSEDYLSPPPKRVKKPRESRPTNKNLPENPRIRVGKYILEDAEIPVLAHLTKTGALFLNSSEVEAKASNFQFSSLKVDPAKIEFDGDFQKSDLVKTKAYIKQYLVNMNKLEPPVAKANGMVQEDGEAVGARELAKASEDTAIVESPNQSIAEAMSLGAQENEVQHSGQDLSDDVGGRGSQRANPQHPAQDFGEPAVPEAQVISVQVHPSNADQRLRAVWGEVLAVKNDQQTEINTLKQQVQELNDQNEAKNQSLQRLEQHIRDEKEKKDNQVRRLEDQLAKAKTTPAVGKLVLEGTTYQILTAPNVNEGLYVEDQGKFVTIGSTRYRETEVLSEYQELKMNGVEGETVELDGLKFKRIFGGPYDGRLVQQPGPKALVKDESTGKTFVRYLIRKEEPLGF